MLVAAPAMPPKPNTAAIMAILNNHRLKTVGLGYGLKARIRID